MLTAYQQHQQQAERRQKGEQGVEERFRVRQLHVAPVILAIQPLEFALLRRLLNVRPHNAHAGQILLNHGRDCAQLILNALIASMQDTAEVDGQRRQQQHGYDAYERQLQIDAHHHEKGEQHEGGGVHGVHHGRPDRHAYVADVVDGAAHQVARPARGEEGRIHAQQMIEEGDAQIVLDAPADAVQKLAHAEAGSAARECYNDQQQGIFPQRRPGRGRLGESIDSMTNEYGAYRLEHVGKHDEYQSGENAARVRRHVRQERLKRVTLRARGESAR